MGNEKAEPQVISNLGLIVNFACIAALVLILGALAFYKAFLEPENIAARRHDAACDTALATPNTWVDEKDEWIVRDDCTNLLDVSLEPCSVNTKLANGERVRGDAFYCHVRANAWWNKDTAIITAYHIRRGEHGELVEAGVFPGSEITLY